MKFRRLNKVEHEAYISLAHKSRVNNRLVGANIRVQYINRDGGFTIAIVQDIGNANLNWVGVSRRSNKDRPNRVRGNMLAFIRAITNPPVER